MLKANRLQIVPQFVELEPYENGSVRTMTTIQLNHPDCFPQGIFEYQHADGKDAIKSLLFGFIQWYQQCLIPIVDSLNSQPGACQELKKIFPAKNGSPQLTRRLTFGQPLWLVTGEQHDVTARELSDEEHDYCHCCLFSKNIKTFAPLFESNSYICLLLFAARDPNGYAESDCRINGEDFPEGKQALSEYVATWPHRGFEARKQFVILSNDIRR